MNTYLQIIMIALIAFTFALLVIPRVIKRVNKKGLLAQPNHRTSHEIPTPSMGGIGIFLGLLTVLPFLDYSIEITVLMITVTVLFIVGFYDDVYEMKSIVKLIIQLICAMGLYFAGFAINSLHGIFGIHEISETFSFVLTILFIVGVTNAFNLIDGIDGLAGGISLINGLFFGFIFLLNNQTSYVIIAFALVGAILGFLKYNYHPAKIFMGDTGSLFLGLLMSIFVIKTLQTNTSRDMSVSLVVILILASNFEKKKSIFSR